MLQVIPPNTTTSVEQYIYLDQIGLPTAPPTHTMHTSFLALAALVGFASAHPVEWYQASDSPISKLFVKRDANPDDPSECAVCAELASQCKRINS